eukprot:CAMPEP_0117864730 /NCGR_PEP_ID=MMETSP0950-20121206/6326_1 /TAXON_ID=44440 /ORGANISM="Chattonella subsalsa, Strain CCMP2191" /LENGTH=501 /DNA_ID=CAMNT_0005715697 /DNA_START=13 /DNA_END=1518 /DNA_ORIENTATION=+
MTKRILASNRMAAATNYCIGAIRDTQLHLTPVNALCQMHPDFRHIDEAVEEVKMIDDEEEEGKKKEKPKKMELQQVAFKKKETEDQKARRQSTYSHMRDELRHDPFVELTVHDADSDNAFDEFDRLFCQTPAPSRRFRQHGSSYLSALNYRGEKEQQTASGFGKPTADAQNSEQQPAAMPLSEKVLQLLRRAGVVSFRAMLDCEAGVQGEDELVSALMRHAVLVRGNWVLRSSQREHLSNLQIMARDCILVMMEKFGAISRPQLQETLSAFTPPQLIEILSEFATLNKKLRRWEMKIPDCYQFIEEFGAVAAEQQRQWTKREREIASLLQMIGEPQCPVIGPVKKPPVERVRPPTPPVRRQEYYDSEEEVKQKVKLDIEMDKDHKPKKASLVDDDAPRVKMEMDEPVEPKTESPVKMEEEEEPAPPLTPKEVKEKTFPEQATEPIKTEPQVEKVQQNVQIKKGGVLQPGVRAGGIISSGQRASFKPKMKPKPKPKPKPKKK